MNKVLATLKAKLTPAEPDPLEQALKDHARMRVLLAERALLDLAGTADLEPPDRRHQGAPYRGGTDRRRGQP